ncbi:MAG: 1-(5-phosphoribosyl)-5-[Lachnospiraceae bacterium]|nr:1-(5-phosphoribosyl)-5-[(5-phosphoribosylamino)methylideneamino]imidazole-4-carboxamide isomerase [Lachnospiraceae bacterium]
MILFPAIDLYEGQAVRLLRGAYDQRTVYSDRPWEVAVSFFDAGADHLHLVDLAAARDGGTPNEETVYRILDALKERAEASGRPAMFTELGGGIRSIETAEKYLNAGISRVILGTAAVTDEAFLKEAAERFDERVAVSADLKDGYVAIRGWMEKSALSAEDFFKKLTALGIGTLICTDISKDGAMEGPAAGLYEKIQKNHGIRLIASGGISSMTDIARLKEIGVYGAIIGKALYTGDLQLREALEAAK